MIFLIGLVVWILGKALDEVEWWSGSLICSIMIFGGLIAMAYSIAKFIWVTLP